MKIEELSSSIVYMCEVIRFSRSLDAIKSQVQCVTVSIIRVNLQYNKGMPHTSRKRVTKQILIKVTQYLSKPHIA